jgi:hypothetical protein
MLQHIAECQEDTWRALWVEPILEMLSHASTSLCGPLQALLSTAVSHYPRLLTHILQPIISDMCPKATHLRTVLSCIRLARKQGALDDQAEFQHSSTLWKGVLDVRILEETLYHRDVEVSNCAIYGIFTTRKYLLSYCKAFQQVLYLHDHTTAYRIHWRMGNKSHGFLFCCLLIMWKSDSVYLLHP